MSDSHPSLHSEYSDQDGNVNSPSFPALEYPETSGVLSPLPLPLSGTSIITDYTSSLWLNEHILYCKRGDTVRVGSQLVPWYGWHSSMFFLDVISLIG